MNTQRGGWRNVRRWPARRTRWFVPATVVLVGVATAGILTAPRAGLDLADAPAPLSPAEAAPATAGGSTTAPSAPTPASTLVAAPAATTTPVAPVVTTPTDVAAADLESFFVAIEGGDLVGAFDHLAPGHQEDIGGFELFRAVWMAPAQVAHERAQCAADEGDFECTITFRTYDSAGVCSSAVYAYRLTPTGTRRSIVSERPIAQRSCPALVTTTTAATG